MITELDKLAYEIHIMDVYKNKMKYIGSIESLIKSNEIYPNSYKDYYKKTLNGLRKLKLQQINKHAN